MPLDFEGKPLKSLSQGDVDFGLVPVLDEAAKSDAESNRASSMSRVLAAVKDALGERVSDVRASQRLTDSPACLVAGAGPDRELERLLARQNRSGGAKPILELNMRHPLVKAVSAPSLMHARRKSPILPSSCSRRRRSSMARFRLTRQRSQSGSIVWSSADWRCRANAVFSRVGACSPSWPDLFCFSGHPRLSPAHHRRGWPRQARPP